MTGKWLSAVLVAAALLTAAGGMWYANAQQQNTAAPAAPAAAKNPVSQEHHAAENPVGQEHRDEALPPGALFGFGTVDRDGVRTVSAYSRDGRFVAVGDDLGHLDMWDARTGKKLHVLRTEGPPVRKLAFTPDGRSLAEGRDDVIQFRAVPDGVVQHTLRHNSPPWHLAFSPDGRDMLYGCFPWHLCDPVTGQARWTKYWQLETGTFSADGKTLFIVSVHNLDFLDAASGELQKSVPLKTPAPPNCGICSDVTLSPDGRRLALGMQTGHVYFCDPRTGLELTRFHAAGPSARRTPREATSRLTASRKAWSSGLLSLPTASGSARAAARATCACGKSPRVEKCCG